MSLCPLVYFFFFFKNVLMCVCDVHVRVLGVLVWRSEVNLQRELGVGSLLPPCGLRDGTQDVRLGDKSL